MLKLFLASLTFFLLHRVVSGSRLRDLIVGRIGEKIFQPLFGLASFGCVTWLWLGYLDAQVSASNFQLFAPIAWMRPVQAVLQFAAILLIVTGLSTRNPAIAGLGAVARQRDIVRGVLRITRHPFLWGISIFSAGHMLVVPDAASWGFFGTLFILAATGTVSIDAKRKRLWGRDWQAFADQTSNLPFQAVLGGRQPLRLKEIGLLRLLLALAVYVLLVIAHPYLFGASIWPWY